MLGYTVFWKEFKKAKFDVKCRKQGALTLHIWCDLSKSHHDPIWSHALTPIQNS